MGVKKIDKNEEKIQSYQSEIEDLFSEIEKTAKTKTIHLPLSKIKSRSQEIQKLVKKIDDTTVKMVKLLEKWDAS